MFAVMVSSHVKPGYVPCCSSGIPSTSALHIRTLSSSDELGRVVVIFVDLLAVCIFFFLKQTPPPKRYGRVFRPLD